MCGDRGRMWWYIILLQSHSQASTPRFLMGWSWNETMTGSATADSTSQLDHTPSVVSLLASKTPGLSEQDTCGNH